MGKGMKKDKGTYAQKKEAFWKSLPTQKLRDVRAGLMNTGIEAQTRNDEGFTSFMIAAKTGAPKTLDCLLDYYERRRELRRKGWINLRDDQGRTALMMACSLGNVEMVESLLKKNANHLLKDDQNMTARDIAEKKGKTEVLQFIDYWFSESDEEEETGDGIVHADGLTSTQRNKLKKKKLKELEQRGMKKEKASKEQDSDGDDDDLNDKGPSPVWPEIGKIIESIEMLRPVHEITVVRENQETIPKLVNGVDPALWYLRNINRLELKLAPGVLTSIPGKELGRLRKLQALILNQNGLTSLPEEIGKLKQLKILEIAGNQIEALPNTMSKLQNLQILDASFNKLTSVEPLQDLTNFGSINLCGNQFEELDFNYDNLGRLTNLVVSHNKIKELDEGIGKLAALSTLNAENNEIQQLPLEITQLKKLKVLKFAQNPIKDSKVVKMLEKDARKDLWKYLIKTGGGGKKGSKKKGKGKKNKNKDEDDNETAAPPTPPPIQKVQQNDDDEDDEADGNFSDDSFDISMDEL